MQNQGKMKTALVIGSGLGGLTTALRLSKLGYKVKVVEQYHQPGGRLNRLQKDGFSFDLAPSFFSMSYEFTQFSKDTGLSIPFEFIELDPLYTVHFRNDTTQYRIFKDLDVKFHHVVGCKV